MNPQVIKYGAGRFPVQPSRNKCRGCHTDVPKGRLSWCSNKCYDTYDPKRVRWFCQQRDKNICHHCGIDTNRERMRYKHAYKLPPVNHRNYYGNDGGFIFRRDEYDRAVAIANRHIAARRIAAKNRLERMRLEGWPWGSNRDWWEMDHIIPYSEGGLTILANVRTLCVPCHKTRTKKWYKDKNQKNQTCDLFP
jgi:hypothetical protein